jgi:hypothetical protein
VLVPAAETNSSSAPQPGPAFLFATSCPHNFLSARLNLRPLPTSHFRAKMPAGPDHRAGTGFVVCACTLRASHTGRWRTITQAGAIQALILNSLARGDRLMVTYRSCRPKMCIYIYVCGVHAAQTLHDSASILQRSLFFDVQVHPTMATTTAATEKGPPCAATLHCVLGAIFTFTFQANVSPPGRGTHNFYGPMGSGSFKFFLLFRRDDFRPLVALPRSA